MREKKVDHWVNDSEFDDEIGCDNKMNPRQRFYFDHAATSWPKSEKVLHAMIEFMRDCGVAAGRGGYRSAVEADQVIALTRKTIASLIDAVSASCISFHANGTTALNVGIHGVIRNGDHVVVSAAEHNSVLRPLDDLVSKRNLRLTVVPVGAEGEVDADRFLAAVEPDTRMAVLTHASNVTGSLQPVAEVGRHLRETSTLLLCDAAQTFGAIPVSVKDLGVDLLAAPGHKCSGGPLGTAFLYVDPNLHDEFQPSVFGGTGSQSESLKMPEEMPSKLEPGNLNVPAIVGWSAALSELPDLKSREMQNQSVAAMLREGLRSIDNLKVYAGEGPLPVVSLAIDDLPPSDFAAILDSEFGIEVRAGLHCAALIHSCIGTQEVGTLRISASSMTSESDLQYVIDSVKQVTQEVTGS